MNGFNFKLEYAFFKQKCGVFSSAPSLSRIPGWFGDCHVDQVEG